MSNQIENIKRDLIGSSDEETRIRGESFFKEPVRFHGVKSAGVHILAKEHYKNLPDKNKMSVFGLCEELWKSGFMEECLIACEWSYNVHKQYFIDDFVIFEEWVTRYVTNWATCDTLCNHSVGSLVEMYPSLLQELKRWAKSENKWMRRASAVSLIIPAKKGLFLTDILEIADILFRDKEDLVQKGYGWMLKAASQSHQKEVFDYIMKNKGEMPRTSLRYAIEKMTPEMRRRAMEK
jgi:3-methyladenine DNA glycosylase AlkD